jgi:hypothetical protein
MGTQCSMHSENVRLASSGINVCSRRTLRCVQVFWLFRSRWGAWDCDKLLGGDHAWMGLLGDGSPDANNAAVGILD